MATGATGVLLPDSALNMRRKQNASHTRGRALWFVRGGTRDVICRQGESY